MTKSILLLPRLSCAAVKPHPLASNAVRNLGRLGLRQASSTSSQKQEPDGATSSHESPPPKPPSMGDVLSNIQPEHNPLLAPVYTPEDANAILKSNHPAVDILTQSAIIVQRQIEMMNLFLGFEQANRYVMLDPSGNHIGYMAEHDDGIGHTMKRQFFHTHRAFTTHVFDRSSREVLRFHRPFSWINSRIRVYDAWDATAKLGTSTSTSLAVNNSDPLPQPQVSSIPLEAMRVIGETHSEWAPLRRKFNLFLSHDLSLANGSNAQQQQTSQHNSSGSSADFRQFARVDSPFLSWHFPLRDESGQVVGDVDRQFRGFGREIFTDTGSYVLSMDSAKNQEQVDDQTTVADSHQNQRAYAGPLGGNSSTLGMTLDQRAVMLATAVTIDYDYFSRHSGGSGMLPFVAMGEAGGAGGAAGAAGAGEAVGGAVVGGAGRAVGTAAGGATGMGEGAIAGAGTIAGYEAMQRGMGRSEGPVDDASPQAPPPEQAYGQPYDPQSPQAGDGGQNPGEDTWGTADSDPWSEAASNAGSGGEGEGGGWLSTLWDSFWSS